MIEKEKTVQFSDVLEVGIHVGGVVSELLFDLRLFRTKEEGAVKNPWLEGHNTHSIHWPRPSLAMAIFIQG